MTMVHQMDKIILSVMVCAVFTTVQSFVLQTLLSKAIIQNDSSETTIYPDASTSQTQDQQECICTPFNLCKTYVPAADGGELIDIRSNFGPCSSYMDICCNDKFMESTENYIPITSTDSSITDNSSTDSSSIDNSSTDSTSRETDSSCTCSGKEENKTKTSSIKDNTMTTPDDYSIFENLKVSTEPTHISSNHQGDHKCGVWNKNGVGFRIVNAVDGESQYSEYPSMVAIFKEEVSKTGTSNLLYHCGGSLIKENVVLTAAHCVIKKDPSTLVVRAGEWDLKTDKEIHAHQDRRVSKIVTHHNYYAGGLHNDVALIFTEEPFYIQENVKVMCLPEENDIYTNSMCFSSGWGKTVNYNNYTIVKKTESGNIHEIGHYEVSILKKVELPVVSRDKCTEALRKTRLGPKFELHDSFICAGGEEGKDTCKGDGGSPLMCPSKNDPDYLVQVGIVAWGINCGIADIPAVYVDVAGFRKWIDNEIENHTQLVPSIRGGFSGPNPTPEPK